MLYRKLVSSILFFFTITLLHAQLTAGLPKAVLTNKAGNSVSTASMSDFDNPVIVITYSERWSAWVNMITEFDNNYNSLGTSSNVKIYAVNIDRSTTSSEVFSKASRWKNVEVLFDRSQQLAQAMYNNTSVIFFLDDNQQVIYHNISMVDVKKAYKLAGQIKQRVIQARKVFYDKDWFPCPEKEAVYYRLINKTNDDKWQVNDYYKNGSLQMQGQAILPYPLVRQGKYQYYYQDGKLSSEAFYNENMRIGRSLGYYNNGTTQFDYSYTDGRLDGKWTKYHANGKVAQTGMYESGYKKGVFYHYYESGKKKKETNWANGKMNGKCTGWYENGKLKYEAHFVNSELSDAPVPKYFHENGRPAVEVKKTAEGESLSYINDNGIVTLLLEESGTLFELTQYYDDGQLQMKATLKDEETVNGKYISWYKNGQKQFEATFYNNEPSGKAISWYEDGGIKEKVDFTNNIKEYFDKQGNKVTAVTDPVLKINKGQKLSTKYISDRIKQLETIIKEDGAE